MTEILSIDPGARAEAVRRSLARAGAGPVAVILPDGWRELDSVARMRLVQRQAQLRSQDLALVTRDMATRNAAQQLGIPVFPSEGSLRGKRWRMRAPLPLVDPRKPDEVLPEPPPWRNGRHATSTVEPIARPTRHRSRQKRIAAEKRYRRPAPFWLRLIGYIFVGLAMLLFLGSFFYYVLPAATVTLVPGQRALEARALLTADPAVEVADLEAGLIPARLTETFVERTGSIATSGSEQTGTELARGTINITNQTNSTIRIPAGTIVSTGTGTRIDFRTLTAVEVPGPRGTRASVAVEATDPGAQGNVRANTITEISGALRTQVQVTNPGGTGGGQSGLVRVVKQVDKDQLLDRLFSEIEAEAYELLLPEIRDTEWLAARSVQPLIVAQFFDHFNDEPADELTLTLRVLIQGVAVDEAPTREAAMSALEAAVPDRGQLVADSIRFLVDQDATVTGRQVQFSAVAQGNYVIPIDARAIRSEVAGLSPDAASERLQAEYLLAEEPRFYQDPAWFGTLPQIASRIQVRVELDEAARQGP